MDVWFKLATVSYLGSRYGMAGSLPTIGEVKAGLIDRKLEYWGACRSRMHPIGPGPQLIKYGLFYACSRTTINDHYNKTEYHGTSNIYNIKYKLGVQPNESTVSMTRL